MDEVQPPNAPPEERRIRTDAGARVVVDRIDAMREELAVLKAAVGQAVTYRYLLAGIGACAFTVIGAAVWVILQTSAMSKAAGDAAMQVALEAKQSGARLEVFVKTELQDARREQREDIAGVKRALERSRRPSRDVGQ